MSLFLTKNQTLLMRLFYTNPDKAFFIQEIGRIVDKKPGIFQRALYKLEEEGVLKSFYQANARFFQADTAHPLYPELKRIIFKTVGVPDVLRSFLKKLKEVKVALLYGSFAKGVERKDSDIDLLVIGSPEMEKKLLKNIPDFEKIFQREINYKIYSESEFNEKLKGKNPFLMEILSDQFILLKGAISNV
jgi:predicted nucleotidyltransferase